MARFRSISIAKRRSSSRSHTPDTVHSMASTSTTASSTRTISEANDTGFPDLPRTTKWRHPEADTSPHACITAEDIDPAKTLHRHHRLFLQHKYKRTTSHGFISEAMEREYLKPKDNADGTVALDDGRASVAGDGDARPSKDDTESLDRTDGSMKSHHPISPTVSQFEQNGSPSRRKSLFRRIRDHKH